MQQDLADLFSEPRSSGFASNGAGIPGRDQASREPLSLGRFARALRPLEGQKEPAPFAAVEVHSPSLAEPRPSELGHRLLSS